jgi:SAM-dependent methyltransferase
MPGMHFENYVDKTLKEYNVHPQKICDLGCGPNKFPNSFGVDGYPFPGVDRVMNLDEAWDLEDNSFDVIVAHQVFEHIQDPCKFLKQLHRIAKPGALIFIAVPHFSSSNSYKDPTHRRHLSVLWSDSICEDNYLKTIVGGFETVTRELTFGKGFGDAMARFYIKRHGFAKYERRAAFKYPAIDVYTVLKVHKSA